jgi:hypothetical protein
MVSGIPGDRIAPDPVLCLSLRALPFRASGPCHRNRRFLLPAGRTGTFPPEHPYHTLYKCDNDACPHYLQRKNALNWRERFLRQLKSSRFKLRYQYRVYHFQPRQLAPAAPERPVVDLRRIHRSGEVLGPVLAFHVFFALSARKTAQVLRRVFGVP